MPELRMAWGDRFAEEWHLPIALMQDYVEPSLGGVAFNNKLSIEGWQLENRHRGQGTLKCPKSGLRFATPMKAFLAQ
jgi:hypothetical protein